MHFKLHLGNIRNNLDSSLLCYILLTILILCYEFLQVETHETQHKHDNNLFYNIHQHKGEHGGINTFLFEQVFLNNWQVHKKNHI